MKAALKITGLANTVPEEAGVLMRRAYALTLLAVRFFQRCNGLRPARMGELGSYRRAIHGSARARADKRRSP